jgi:acylphosphatase
MAKERLQAYFTGSVQGVGFRFTAQHIARNLKINGWVKNLDDGRVEVVAEGTKESLEDFMKQLDSYFKSYISDTEIDWQEPEGLQGFLIKF